MSHCDPEALTLSALGEAALDAADVAHLDRCRTCRAELDAAVRTVQLARGPDDGADVQPPPQVWESITAELGLPSRAAAPPQAARQETAAGDVTSAPVHDAAAQRSRPGPSARTTIATAAAVLVVATAATTVVVMGRDGPRELAATELDPVDSTTSGSALLLDTDVGLRLDVDVTGLADTEGYYEVWLIDPSDGTSMISLGALPTSGAPVELVVPTRLDTQSYTVVDISDEPYDGDPSHSRVSVARGALRDTT